MKKVLVLASGRGTDFQAIIDHERLGIFEGIKVEGVVCNHFGATVLDRGKSSAVKTFLIEGVAGRKFAGSEERESARHQFDQQCLAIIRQLEIDIVVLAGFNQILTKGFVVQRPPLILNIHPAYDTERFGGKNMVGSKVHEMVLESGVKFSGCTVHLVTAEVDLGAPIVKKKVSISSNESVQSLESKVLALEHLAYPEALQLVADGRVIISDDGTKSFVDRLSGNWDSNWFSRQNKYLETHEQEFRILSNATKVE
ncbi:MAG: phosphoribosylglycinamide formyltransferase [Nitrososphaerales archaeon]